MKAVVELWIDLPNEHIHSVVEPMRIESFSAPREGRVEVVGSDPGTCPLLVMSSDDLSTARAMMNSYLGLVSAAVRTLSFG